MCKLQLPKSVQIEILKAEIIRLAKLAVEAESMGRIFVTPDFGSEMCEAVRQLNVLEQSEIVMGPVSTNIEPLCVR